ncbi:3,4-dihydroxy-2-butanone-4-phosphate synthase, partial [Singulisphaera rosea]
MANEFSKIEDAVQAMADGRVVIVVDDEQRENEGDFIAAADRITPETIEFMITQGRGQLCVPIMPDLAARLEMHPMVERNTAPHRTPFTVMVDHLSCRTGISAEERARTVR